MKTLWIVRTHVGVSKAQKEVKLLLLSPVGLIPTEEMRCETITASEVEGVGAQDTGVDDVLPLESSNY